MAAQPAAEDFAKSETRIVPRPVRSRAISIKEKEMSTKELNIWLKKREKAEREFKRIGKITKIAEKAVHKEIRVAQRIVKILNDDDAIYVRDKLRKKIHKSEKLEQRLNKHLKRLMEHFKVLKGNFTLNHFIKERLKKAIESLQFYYLLFHEFWEGGFGFEKELKEWTTDSLSALRRQFPIYLHNLIDLLGMLQKLDKLEEAIIESERIQDEETQKALLARERRVA